MAKFNTRTAPGSSPVRTATTPTGRTYEGGPGFARDQKSELFLLAVTNMVGEATFYESAGDRDSRFARLVRDVAVADPAWVAGFLGWLRSDANLRSASLVGALEATRALVDAGVPGGRQLVAAVLKRADEPGEALAYWTSRYGRAIPKPVKRGIADAIARLYTEYGLLKYDTASKGFRFADAIDLVHPVPAAPWQGDLFQVALERRHNRDEVRRESLPMLTANGEIRQAAATDPRVLLDADRLRAAGMTWEDVLSLAGDRLDKAALWSALVPGMGYTALLRNLRNLDQAGVSDAVAGVVAARLADPTQVSASRQLPMRFLSAYRAAPSLRWAYPLEQAIGHSLASVPALPGRTLVLVDTSYSMNAGFSKDGTLRRWDAAVIFGVALAQRCAAADVVSFSTSTKVFPLVAGESLLRSIERWKAGGFFLGDGTDTSGALRRHFARHDRVVVVTDEQAAAGGSVDRAVPASVPMFTWNLAGYRMGHAPSGSGNRHTFGGLTDQAFRMIPLLSAGRDADWLWLVG
ncbi:TROVE domain-containing protein [Asanoa hainanensis]|uniref:TROVE domain-containing protein n=1 Tax=Asanoa hainanensis TaxID=560556 RepID=A0A239PDL5_9ACTN|nr:TROVE domain-containing protein [Asanoa hainanensis]SNT65120.1 TROVE domain-containing protein [Asanoa hainanensis]